MSLHAYGIKRQNLTFVTSQFGENSGELRLALPIYNVHKNDFLPSLTCEIEKRNFDWVMCVGWYEIALCESVAKSEQGRQMPRDMYKSKKTTFCGNRQKEWFPNSGEHKRHMLPKDLIKPNRDKKVYEAYCRNACDS
ncbi:13401_t:CDS:2, partial [Acaulospora morrowiae]